jgi:hypothetical protein
MYLRDSRRTSDVALDQIRLILAVIRMVAGHRNA